MYKINNIHQEEEIQPTFLPRRAKRGLVKGVTKYIKMPKPMSIQKIVRQALVFKKRERVLEDEKESIQKKVWMLSFWQARASLTCFRERSSIV